MRTKPDQCRLPSQMVSSQNSKFPNELKLADLTPILKKEDPSRAKNYKSVSVLPSVSKVFERILHRQVSSYVDQFLPTFM